MLVPGGANNVRPEVGEAGMRAGENLVGEGVGVECQKEGGNVGMGEQLVEGGVETVARDGGGAVAEGDDGGGKGNGGGDRVGLERWRGGGFGLLVSR